MLKFFKRLSGFFILSVIIYAAAIVMVICGCILLISAPLIALWAVLDKYFEEAEEKDYDDDDEEEDEFEDGDSVPQCAYNEHFNGLYKRDYCETCEYQENCREDVF